MNRKRGFIIPLVLMLISIAMLITTTLYQRGSLFIPFMTTFYQREQAKALALSGIQIAMSQLAATVDEKATDAQSAKEGDKKALPGFLGVFGVSQKATEQLFINLFPTIGQWQEYPLKKEIDGINGSIKIAVC